MADLKKEKNRRAAFKRWLAEDVKKLDQALTATPVDISLVSSLHKVFIGRLDELQRSQFQIEALSDDADSEFSAELAYQDSLFQTRARVEKVLFPAPSHVSSSVSPLPAATSMPHTTQVRLPKYNLPVFTGQYVDFTSFKESFLCAVEHVDDRGKLNYLKEGALSGPAKAAIEGLALEATNFKIAWDILEEQYGRPSKLRKAHYRALLSLSTPACSAVSLRDFYNEIFKHTRSLERLGVKSETFGEILCEIVTQHLPPQIFDEWSRHLGSKDDMGENLEELMKFLKQEITIRERPEIQFELVKASTSAPQPKLTSPSRNTTQTLLQQAKQPKNNRACPFCDELGINADHHPGYCDNAKRFPVSKIHELIKHSRRCYVCFGLHQRRFCRSGIRCGTCGGRHNALFLCDTLPSFKSSRTPSSPKPSSFKPTTKAAASQSKLQKSNKPNRVGNQVATAARAEELATFDAHEEECGASSSTTVGVSSGMAAITGQVLLQTAIVHAIGQSGLVQRARILFDSASDRSYITSALAQSLNCRPSGSDDITLFAFGGLQVASHSSMPCVDLTLRDPVTGAGRDLRVIVTDHICIPPRSPPLSVMSLPHLRGLRLADPPTVRRDGGDISVLVGSDYLAEFLTGEVVKSAVPGPMAMGTIFGFAISGPVPGPPRSCASTNLLQSSGRALESTVRAFWQLESIGILDNPSDPSEEDAAMQDFLQNVHYRKGRYEVALPWSRNHPPLMNNQASALKRLSRLQEKLSTDTCLERAYTQALSEFEEEGYVEGATEQTECLQFYLPHRPVLKQDSRTYRVRPVFDAGARGPNGVSLNRCLYVGPSLLPLLVDIIISFRLRQHAYTSDIKRAFLQVNVREEDRDVLRFFWRDSRGITASFRFCRVPFGVSSSPFLLQATIRHHLSSFQTSAVAAEMKTSFYMDNFFGNADSVEEADSKSQEAFHIMQQAGMLLREWTTNSAELRERWRMSDFRQSSGSSADILGLPWDLHRDVFSFSPPPVAQPIETKRQFLSLVSRVFDPMGLLGGYTLRGKLILQEIWKSSLSWDEILPSYLLHQVRDFQTELSSLGCIRIPRWFFRSLNQQPSARDIRLHMFADASTRGYGCSVYLTGTVNGRSSAAIIISKNRVPPLTKVSLPRLELMGCLIGARLLTRVRTSFPEAEVHCWTDSMVALGWIRDDPSRWGVYVANRVREIQQLTKPKMWRHVPGGSNPADSASRSKSLKEMMSDSLWWEGPRWLCLPPSYWPVEPHVQASFPVEESKEASEDSLVAVSVTQMEPSVIPLENFSSLCRPLRCLAWILRFRMNCVAAGRRRGLHVLHDGKELEDGSELLSGPLRRTEIFRAELVLIRHAQRTSFPVEWNALCSGGAVSRKSSLFRLKLAWDVERHLLVTDGRGGLRLILLPAAHPLTRLICRRAHEQSLHSGIEATLARLRESYWVTRGRRAVRGVLFECRVCRRYKVQHYQQVEAPLPPDRITPAKPFQVCGIDFAGPFYVKEGKVYLCLFSCAVTRAFHIEMVEDLSTDRFFLALRRFLSRRMGCSTVYSDNALTFSRARHLLNDQIQWKFIVSRAPWWGAFYERCIGSIKSSLRKILRKTLLTARELETVLIEIEASLNRRPLIPINDSIEEDPPLTPAHFFDGAPPSVLDQETTDFAAQPFLLPLWRKRRELLRKWWKRWKQTYLLQLHEWRSKSRSSGSGIFPSVGDIVIIEEDGCSRLKWPLARIEKIFVGRDGIARAALVKRGKHYIRRPTKKLYPLECCPVLPTYTPQLASCPDDHLSDPKTDCAPFPDSQSAVQDATSAKPAVMTRAGRVVLKPDRYKPT